VTKRVSDIRRAPPDWRADGWHLERAYPKEFGDRQAIALRLEQQTAAMIDEEITLLAEEFGISPAEVRREMEVLGRQIDDRRRAAQRNGHGSLAPCV
jgi:hypothetical protein